MTSFDLKLLLARNKRFRTYHARDGVHEVHCSEQEDGLKFAVKAEEVMRNCNRGFYFIYFFCVLKG